MLATKFEAEKRSFKFTRLYLPIVVALVFLVVVEIWVSHSLVSYGEQFKNIENLQTAISSENQLLENAIDKYSALNSIASSSAGLGMETPKEIKYIR